MKIGNLNLDNRVFLSPMAGVTDLPFRLICKEQDCGMLYTEMVNAKALCYDDQNTKKMLKIEEEELPCGTAARQLSRSGWSCKNIKFISK